MVVPFLDEMKGRGQSTSWWWKVVESGWSRADGRWRAPFKIFVMVIGCREGGREAESDWRRREVEQKRESKRETYCD